MVAHGFELLEPNIRRDPYEAYARARRTTPVQRVGALNLFLIYRYADVQEILRNTEQWARPETTLRPPGAGAEPSTDDPGRRLRGLLNQVFAPRVMPRIIREREAHIRTLVERLLDEALAKGRVDFVDALASPLPVTVIAEILGVPLEDRDRFRAWSNEITSAPAADLFGRPVDLEHQQRTQGGRQQMYDYFTRMAEQRRAEPKEDLVTALVHAEFEGKRVTHDEMLEILVLLLIAGNENTTSLVGNAAVQFLHRPEVMRDIRRDPDLLAGALEEVLRYESPFPFDPRIAARPIELHGVPIAQGQMVACLLGSANRDETVFDRADEFDIRRSPNRHIAFGFGPHFCLGANLARLEARIAFEVLLKRTSKIELASADPLPLNESIYLRGFRSIPVLLEAA